MEQRVHKTSLVDEIRRPRTLKERMADRVALGVGSWTFIGTQTGLVILWVMINTFWPGGWDHYPFVLMNVILSLQAAYTAPIIMMSQNRHSAIDRREAHLDYEVNRHTRLGVDRLQEMLHQNENHLSDIRALVESIAGCPGCRDRLRSANRRLDSTIRPGPSFGDSASPGDGDPESATLVPDVRSTYRDGDGDF